MQTDAVAPPPSTPTPTPQALFSRSLSITTERPTQPGCPDFSCGAEPSGTHSDSTTSLKIFSLLHAEGGGGIKTLPPRFYTNNLLCFFPLSFEVITVCGRELETGTQPPPTPPDTSIPVLPAYLPASASCACSKRSPRCDWVTSQLGQQVSSRMRTHTSASAAACFSLPAVGGATSPVTGERLNRQAEGGGGADELRFLAPSRETTSVLTYACCRKLIRSGGGGGGGAAAEDLL